MKKIAKIFARYWRKYYLSIFDSLRVKHAGVQVFNPQKFVVIILVYLGLTYFNVTIIFAHCFFFNYLCVNSYVAEFL